MREMERVALLAPPRTPGQDLYLPLGGGLALTQMVAWHVPDKSPGWESHDGDAAG